MKIETSHMLGKCSFTVLRVQTLLLIVAISSQGHDHTLLKALYL